MTLTADVIGDLIRRVEALEALSPGEELSANYLTINPANGQVGATFTGLINALGLILPTGTGASPQPANEIVWERQADGAVTALIGSTETVIGLSAFSMSANGQSGDTGGTQMALTSNSVLGQQAQLIASAKPGVGATQVALGLSGDGGSNTPVLIANEAHQSQFLQLYHTQAPAFRQVQFGTSFFAMGTWTAGSAVQPNVAHGLGVVPTAYTCCLIPGGSILTSVYIMPAACDASFLYPEFGNVSGINLSGGTVNFAWAAFV